MLSTCKVYIRWSFELKSWKFPTLSKLEDMFIRCVSCSRNVLHARVVEVSRPEDRGGQFLLFELTPRVTICQGVCCIHCWRHFPIRPLDFAHVTTVVYKRIDYLQTSRLLTLCSLYIWMLFTFPSVCAFVDGKNTCVRACMNSFNFFF